MAMGTGMSIIRQWDPVMKKDRGQSHENMWRRAGRMGCLEKGR